MPKPHVTNTVRRHPRVLQRLRLTTQLVNRAWRENAAWDAARADERELAELQRHVREAGHRPLEPRQPRVAWEDWRPDRCTRL